MYVLFIFIKLYTYLISGLWHARKQASMREDEEMLDMARPKVKPPSHLKGRELDLWHKEQNRLWQKTKKKEQQKESGKCVILF
jgi:mRNA degradation ribonuclease J1/J2